MWTNPIHLNRKIKKTPPSKLTKAEERRYEEIIEIQTLLKEGYTPVQVKEMLHTTYFRIRRYATGEPTKLCRFPRKPSLADPFRDRIIALLHGNTPYKQALMEIGVLGYQGKRTAFVAYCRNLITELGIPYAPVRTAAGVMVSRKRIQPQFHYVSRADVFRWLWSGQELDVKDQEHILDKYPLVAHVRQCVADFRSIYEEKSLALLEAFMASYAASGSKPIQSFASGLFMDTDAVKNSVISALNSAFVEGSNNKIKVIKRIMYGRAKIDLLRVKVLFSR